LKAASAYQKIRSVKEEEEGQSSREITPDGRVGLCPLARHFLLSLMITAKVGHPSWVF
jgi:hypothetical protein